jgi:hypothetical protein
VNGLEQFPNGFHLQMHFSFANAFANGFYLQMAPKRILNRLHLETVSEHPQLQIEMGMAP